MDKITDEMLVAFADGELDTFESEQLATQLAADPELARRLEVFSKTGRNLASFYDQDLQEPIPERLLETVDRYIPTQDIAHTTVLKSGVVRLRSLAGKLPAQEGIWQGAIAAGLALFVGAIMGWQINDFSRSGSQTFPAAIVAQGAFQQTLETEPSGRSKKLGAKQTQTGTLKPLLTFVNRKGGFCREYQLEGEEGRSFFGVACRNKQGAWQIKVHVPGAAQKRTDSKIIPASRRQAEAVDIVVDDLIAGDVLPLKEEASILKEWKMSPKVSFTPRS